MRKVVKKKTKKFIAVVVAAAMVLASGITVPVKAASDVSEGKSVEDLPVLELDKPVTVTKENHQFKFTADEDGRYQFTINGGGGWARLFISISDDMAVSDGFEQSTKYNMRKGGFIYVKCLPMEEDYTLTVTRIKTYKVHQWEDVESVKFRALRDVYEGIDDPLSGLGATFTFKDGTKLEYDGLYQWNSATHFEEFATILALIGGNWTWEWNPDSDSVVFSSSSYNGITVTVSGPIEKSETGAMGTILTGSGTLNLKIQSKGDCPIKFEESVDVEVVKPPVESIEPFGAKTTIGANGGVETDDSYTLYNPSIEGIIVTYTDGTKDVFWTHSNWPNDGVKGTRFADKVPEGHIENGVERNRIDLISNQKTMHWEKGGTYSVTVRYLGFETKFQCTVGEGNQDQYDEQDLYGSSFRLKNKKLFLEHIDKDCLLEVIKNDVLLVPGEDYEVIWYQVTDYEDVNVKCYTKLKGLPTELGVYRLVLLGKGKYKGATIFDGIGGVEVTDIKDLAAYQAHENNKITVSSAKESKAEDFEVYYDISDEEHIVLTPSEDYSFDGWYIDEYDVKTGNHNYTKANELVEGETYSAKLTGEGLYTGDMYVSVHIWEDEEVEEKPTQSPAPTTTPVQTPDVSGGSGEITSTEPPTVTPAPTVTPVSTATPAPTATPVPTQTPGVASGPAIIPDEDTQPTEPTVAPEASDEPSTPTPTPSEPTPKPDKNDDDEEEEYQATTETVNKGGVKATVKTTDDGTAVVKDVKSSKKSVTVSSTVKVDGVEYKVTTIEANAFANCKKATKIALPATVKTIKKEAFTGAKKVKTIVVKSKKAVTVKKGAFKGVDTQKITIKASKMSKKQLKKFKKELKKAGFKGKVKK